MSRTRSYRGASYSRWRRHAYARTRRRSRSTSHSCFAIVAAPMALVIALTTALAMAGHAQAQWSPSTLTSDEQLVLRSLCHIGLKANGGIWSSDRINAAISVLAFGASAPDSAQATAYKVCSAAGGMGR